MITHEDIKTIDKAYLNGDKFEVDFVYFLHQQGYMKDDIFNEKNKYNLNKYRNEFIKGYNFGYKNEI